MIFATRQARLDYLDRIFRSTLPKESDAILTQMERRLAMVYRDNLKVTKSFLADIYEKYAIDGVLTREQLAKYNRFQIIEKSLADKLKELTGESFKITKQGLLDTGELNYLRTRHTYESSLNLNTGLYGVNERLQEAILRNPFDRIGRVSRERLNLEQNLRQLTAAINEGAIQGYPYSKTAALFTDVQDKAFNRTLRIVRTEQHRAANVAYNMAHDEAQDIADRYGYDVRKVWDAELDGVVRDSHAKLDGQFADKDGFFRIDGMTVEYPGGFGIAAEDVNCRCTLRTEVFTDDPQALQERKEVPSFKEWKEMQGAKIIKGK